jgi:hypothetical protein
MKKQENKAHGLYLKHSNLRWKWMAGATAATAAGVTASHADLVTVPLFNNYITATSLPNQGFHLSADLTGDNHADVAMKSFLSTQFTHKTLLFNRKTSSFAQVAINGVLARGYRLYSYMAQTSGIGGIRHHWAYAAKVGALSNATHKTSVTRGFSQPMPPGAVSVTSTIPFSFTDNSINGGVLTPGILYVTASSGNGHATVTLDQFTYNTIPVPEPSSLALLALGAGGVLAFRQRRKAAKNQSRS